MNISQQINAIGRALIDGLKDILDGKLYGVYIYGAAAFPGTFPLGDIDVHVILRSDLTDEEKSRLEKYHEEIDRDYPVFEEVFDGYYILLEDALKKSPPRSQMWQCATDNSWALHREHILAGRQITLYGPAPEKIYQPADWPEIETALYSELDYIEKHLLEYPGYCILNLCRLIYSFENKDVVISKEQAFEWAQKALPKWKKHIELAGKSYSHKATPEEEQLIRDEISRFHEFARDRIERASKNAADRDKT